MCRRPIVTWSSATPKARSSSNPKQLPFAGEVKRGAPYLARECARDVGAKLR
jgi:hypothetical protein